MNTAQLSTIAEPPTIAELPTITEPPTSIGEGSVPLAPRRATLRTRILAVAAAILMLTGIGAITAAPASASGYTTITLPGTFSCNSGTAKLQVPPPRVYSGRGTEQVRWVNAVDRWDSVANRWYSYNMFYNWSSFNSFGQSVTAWSGDGVHVGGSFVNNTLNLSVQHAGYYRIATRVDAWQSGAWKTVQIGNGAYCYIS